MKPSATILAAAAAAAAAAGALPRRRRGRLAWLAGAALGIAVLGSMAGCAGPAIADYAAERPLFDLREYFDGRVTAQGIFTGRSGEVKRRFTVTMDCAWQGDIGTLDEQFVYSDGERQRRVWKLVRHADGRYTGTAADVVGEAEGRTAGNAFNWRYTLALPVGGRVFDVQLDDWMYLMDGGRTVINRATMSKFGVRVGELTLAFAKG